MKLSIITINLNNKDGLEKTIESVVSQTFTDYEFIIIDGGSTKGDVELIKEYENKISYWVSEKDSGIYNAQNKGIKQARGEYLYFLNSGDALYENTTLEKVFKNDPHDPFICGSFIWKSPDSSKQILLTETATGIWLYMNYSPDFFVIRHFLFIAIISKNTDYMMKACGW